MAVLKTVKHSYRTLMILLYKRYDSSPENLNSTAAGYLVIQQILEFYSTEDLAQLLDVYNYEKTCSTTEEMEL